MLSRGLTSLLTSPMLRSRHGRRHVTPRTAPRAPAADADLQGDAFCRAYAAEADEWLSGVADAGRRRNQPPPGPSGRRGLRAELAVPLQRPRCGARPRRAPRHQGRGRRHLVPGLGRGRAPRPLGAPAGRGALGGRRGRPGRPRPARCPAGLGRAQGGRSAAGQGPRPPGATRSAPSTSPTSRPRWRERRSRRRRCGVPARAGPQGEPRRPARRQRAAGPLGLRPPAGRLRRPGLARAGHRPY